MKRNSSMLPAALLDARPNFINSFDKLFDNLMNDAFPSFAKDMGIDFFGKSSYPKVDIVDSAEKVEIRAEIPGLSREEVEIEVDNNDVLTVKGSKQNLSKEEGKTYICKELKHTSFSRKFLLGENLDGEKITADFSNGILNIQIPKKQVLSKEDILPRKVLIN